MRTITAAAFEPNLPSICCVSSVCQIVARLVDVKVSDLTDSDCSDHKGLPIKMLSHMKIPYSRIVKHTFCLYRYMKGNKHLTEKCTWCVPYLA